VIPTCVDTEVWTPVPRPDRSGPPVIGWIGTPTTTPYLVSLQPVFEALARECAFVLRVSGSSTPVTVPGVSVENLPWSLAGEIGLFGSCDIGVYPMPTDEWTLGKCGFKAIQFMACAVPVVASPVGVNTTIIDHGVNGLLAATQDEWLRHLRTLIADAGLRRRLGTAGRQRIESAYSLRAHAPSVVSVFERAARSQHGGAR
jgi:glycosyltransferase involved in cell wall biosynthesis